MQPIQVTVIGTGSSTAFLPDYMQNPFNISIACVLNTAVATFNVQHCFDFRTAYLPTWDGSTNVTWFNNSGITSATANISGNYAFPVAAIRLQVSNAVATTLVTMNITQASNAP